MEVGPEVNAEKIKYRSSPTIVHNSFLKQCAKV